MMADGVRNRFPEGDKGERTLQTPVKKFDNNKFHSRKTIAKGLLDVALLSNNVSNLKQLLKHQGTEKAHPFFEYVVGGLLFSICLQVVIAFILLLVGNKDIDREEDQDSAMQWNDILTGLVLVQTVINVTITQFMDF